MDDPIICRTCGTNYAHQPNSCPICLDPRQFVPATGQAWDKASAIAQRHKVTFTQLSDTLTELTHTPEYAIGQRAILVETPQGNILWDCLAHFDAPALAEIEARGGLHAIAISHPHFFGAVTSLSAHVNAPAYIHAADAHWLQRQGPRITFWSGPSLKLWEGASLHQCGGHFEGSNVLHLDHGNGILLTGDTVAVGADRTSISAMRSYPNRLPLGPTAIQAIQKAMAPLRFDALYSATSGANIPTGAKEIVTTSLTRYLESITT
ncbi:MAG: MBL fold metallo-hydrolase [Pseudomonadota bacterium]